MSKGSLSKMFLTCLIDQLESIKFEIRELSQEELKELIFNNSDDYEDEFPMICNEYTEDANDTVSPYFSKFLTDEEHDGKWIIGEQYGSVAFIMCLQDGRTGLEIDTFEVAKSFRKTGVAKKVIETVECAAEDYYDDIFISPFDTNAMNFWTHMGYVECNNGLYRKYLVNYDY